VSKEHRSSMMFSSEMELGRLHCELKRAFDLLDMYVYLCVYIIWSLLLE